MDVYYPPLLKLLLLVPPPLHAPGIWSPLVGGVVPTEVLIFLIRISHSFTPLLISVLLGLLIPSSTSVLVSTIPMRFRTEAVHPLRHFCTKDVGTTRVFLLLSMIISTFALIPLNIG